MSRNFELIRKADHAIHAHREAGLSAHSLPLSAHTAEDRTAGEQSTDSDLDIVNLWQAIIRRRSWIYFWMITMLAAAGLVCFLMTPQFKAESKLEILKQDTGGLSVGANGASSDGSSDPLDFNMTLQTQLAVLSSDVLAWQVMKELKLVGSDDETPELPLISTGATPEPSETSGPPPTKEAARALKRFKSNLKVKDISGTRLISVSYMDPDPTMAAKTVNQLVSDFVEYNFQVRYKATTRATEWLGRQLVDLKSQVEKSQQRAAELQKESGIFGQDEHNNIVLTRLEQLNNQLTSAEADRVIKENVYKLSRSGNPELIAGMLGSQPERNMSEAANPASLLNSLRQQEATLSAEYADASAKYGPAYPRLIQIKEKLGSVRSSIAAELGKVAARAKNEYELAAEREGAARKAFTEQKAMAAQMNDKATDFLIAKHEAESGRVLYEHLLEKLKEAGVLAGLHSSAFHVLDPAKVPAVADRPNVPLYLGFGGLAGLFLGLLSVFVVEAGDRSMRDVRAIEITTHWPVLGVIPDARLIPKAGLKTLKATLREAPKGASRDVLLLGFGNPVVAEAFRSVRTSLLLSRLDEFSKVLMVTSGMPQEGKSFVSLNLAAAFSNNGAKVLLVDADLRRGTLSRVLNQQSAMGLTDVVRGIPKIDSQLSPSQTLFGALEPSSAYQQIEEVPGLTFMPSGNCSPHACEFLGSQQMSTIIESWRDQFDYIVIDTPPAVPVTDAVVLSRKVDSVIVVVRFAVTTQPCIQRTIRLLKDVQAPRPGVLVNAMDLRSPEYYHYYGFYGVYGQDNPNSRLPGPAPSQPT
ncbi:MAG TPA: polysaccharide biosynthesis tyrosine autokinase [Candidatus Angelobacter sp.]